MPDTIPLMRKVLDHLTQNPKDHDQSKWRKCVAGWVIQIHGEYGFLYDDRPYADASEVIDFRTGETSNTEDVAARLLGLDPNEAAGMFGVPERDALDWLSDLIAAHDSKVLDALAADLDGREIRHA
ncbi:hypothetical protein [Nocardia xishanensis]|uniref:hypothetical protein n=1 Tax=Nocardia xishanensis TaxID=238964 RepID=UPI0008324C0E|nr:hypothetical protein [Nocardia xishanensis]